MRRLVLAVLVGGLLSLSGGAAPAQASPIVQHVTGLVNGVANNFTGTVTIEGLAFPDTRHSIVAIGRLNGTATRPDGTKVVLRNVPFAAPTTFRPATGAATGAGESAQVAACTLIVANIGAIHLDLLGLVVNLAPVNLNVTGLPGGGLLGSLLCSLDGLLSGGTFAQLLALLNQINTLLGGLP